MNVKQLLYSVLYMILSSCSSRFSKAGQFYKGLLILYTVSKLHFSEHYLTLHLLIVSNINDFKKVLDKLLHVL